MEVKFKPADDPFVQMLIRRTLLAMFSPLRGMEVEGNETVEITVKSF